MLRALVEFRIRGVKVIFAVNGYLQTLNPPIVDQHTILVPSSDPRCFHRGKNLDNCESC